MPSFNDPLLTPKGKLKVEVFSALGAKPVPDTKVEIIDKATNKTIEQLITNSSGQTIEINLDAPPEEFVQTPSDKRPYSEYIVKVSSTDFEDVTIDNVQIFANSLALQNIDLSELQTNKITDTIVIPPNTLYGDYPPKIPESEVKPLPDTTGFVVLDKPVIPEFIVVHDAMPNVSAKDYWIPFKSYIKNVASSEIYSTWPEQTIRANIYAILSFTLNRVFTEWYRSKGKNFTITSTTAYDHKFSYGRTIYDNISVIVDEIFTSYITRSGVKQPLLTQYCDGKASTCPGWMTQWGSKYLGDQGYNAIDILRYYYGSDIYLMQAEKVTGVPSSYGGVVLQKGSRGKDVRTIQQQLTAISKNFPYIPPLQADGIYGEKTRVSVQKFQEVFNLPQTGAVDFATWYQISDIYVAVAKLAELR